MTPRDIEKRAHNLIAKKIAEGEEVQLDWAAQELAYSWGEVNGPAKYFAYHCMRMESLRVVKKVVRRYEDRAEPEEKQLSLKGFKHLRVAYTVERNKERVIVPIESLTDEEIQGKEEVYLMLSQGCKEHAIELSEYRRLREKSA